MHWKFNAPRSSFLSDLTLCVLFMFMVASAIVMYRASIECAADIGASGLGLAAATAAEHSAVLSCHAAAERTISYISVCALEACSDDE